MFFIWGSGGNRAVAGQANYRNCNCCNNLQEFVGVVDYRYFHIWYLFSFLTSRRYAVICSQCGNGEYITKSVFKSEYKKDNIPLIRKWGWFFCCLTLALFIVYGINSSNQKSSRNLTLISHPQINDVYYADLAKVADSGYEQEKHAYGLMKIIDEDKDYYYIIFSDTAYTKKKGLTKNLSQLKYLDNAQYIIALSQAELASLYEQNIIYSISRQK